MKEEFQATTPFPNVLLDKVMPHLKDTEWRILCVIVRQTLGWQDRKSKNRKISDWLTQTQLVRKTGRDRAALSRAIDTLVQRDYVEVKSEAGKLLSSPQERRQHKGRLFFALRPRFFAGTATKFNNAKSEYQMPLSNSLLTHEISKSEYHRAPKANTTKEIGTKQTVTKRTSQNSLERLTAEIFCSPTETPEQMPVQETVPKSRPEHSSAAQDFIALFERLYEQTKRYKAVVTLSENEAARLERLLSSQPSLDWQPVLQDFFACDAGYVTRRNHSLSAFLNSCQILLVKTKRMRFGSRKA